MGKRLRVVFFGTTGSLSVGCLRALAAEHRIVGIVCTRQPAPRGARAWLARAARAATGRPGDRAAAIARDCAAALWYVGSRHELPPSETLCAQQPDVVCVSAFPWKVPQPVLARAPLGGVNLHTSLLPRHRGPLPLFWVYHADDRETGVTAHSMTDVFDAGDILGQHAFRLERGYPVDGLNRLHAQVGPAVLRDAVRALADGTAAPRPQDDALVTYAPFVRPGERMVDFASWDVERVWHFLSGLFPRFIEPLADQDGRPTGYGGVMGCEPGPLRAPVGTVARDHSGRLALQCRNGVVYLRPGR